MKILRNILLVEDNIKDVELITEALSEYNLANRIITVKDGVEALEYLELKGNFKSRLPGNPAVILLDIKMQRMDGIETLEKIRETKKFKSIPVVMLTSSREQLDLKRCYELGANAFVVKPVDFKDFIEAIKNVGIFWAILNELPPDTGE